MKRIMFTLALVSSVLVIGCNDSAPVGPETIQPADGVAKALVPAPLPNRGKITLDRTVPLSITPINSPPNLGYLTGTAKFTVAPSPILVRDYVTVSLSMQATLKSLTTTSGAGRTWFFAGESNDQVLASDAGVPAFFVKTYEVNNPTDPIPAYSMKLNIKYKILSGIVSVESVWVSPVVDQF